MAESAYEYWNRVDEILDKKPLSVMCNDLGINYHTLCVMRSEVRFPKRTTGEKIAAYLGVSTKQLMYGDDESSDDPPRVRAIMEKIRTASDMELEMVERILGIGGTNEK